MEVQADFSPGDDLFTIADNVVMLLVTDAADNPLMVGVRAFKRSMSVADVAASGGAFTLTDAWWSLACDDCALPPEANHRLVEPDGTRWRVLTPPRMQTSGTRWKCACRHV